MVPLWVADINIGLLFLLAITSIGVYGIILGGWSSNNKYSLLGGLRSAAQLVSYEVPMGLALVVGAPDDALALARRDRAAPGVDRTSGSSFPGLVAFFIYFVSGVAETNRNPFDLPEAESELVSGLQHRVLGRQVRLLLPRRVHGDDHHLLRGRDGLLRRVAAAVSERAGARRSSGSCRRRSGSSLKVGVFLFALHLVPLDVPALPLRPAHGARLEVADPAGARRTSSWSRSRSCSSRAGRPASSWLSWIFGGVFVAMFLLAKLRQSSRGATAWRPCRTPVEG